MAVIYAAPIAQFDFARMARAMQILRWHWFGNRKRTPSETELRNEAHRLLGSAPRTGSISSGGLVAHSDGVIEFAAHSTGRQKTLDAWEQAKQ